MADTNTALGAAGSPPGTGAPGSGTPPPVTDIRAFMADEAGTFKPGWAKAAGVDESLEAKFRTFKGLSDSYINLEKTLSKDKVPLPGKDATDADLDAFYAKVGRPEKPDGYGFKRPDDLDASMWDDKRVADFSNLAHKLGLTPRQAQGIIDHELVTARAMAKAAADRPAETVALLRKEWGADADAKLAAASAIAKQLGGDEIVGDPLLANHPGFIRAFAKVAEALAEKPGVPGARSQALGAAGGIQAEIDKVMNDPADPYWNEQHPNHDARMAYMLDMRRQLRVAHGMPVNI